MERCSEIGVTIKSIISDPTNECFVVNIGASEMRERGIRPDNFKLFENLLASAGIDHLPRINPMLIFDVSFFDRCVFGSDETVKLSEDINSILFGNSDPISIETEGIDSQAGRKWLNRLCDVHSMWCHIQNNNDVFLTADGNFTKETKLPQLLELGAGRICHPCEL